MRTLPAAAVLPRGGARTFLAVENVLKIVDIMIDVLRKGPGDMERREGAE